MEFGGSHGNVLQMDLSIPVARAGRPGQPNHITCQPSPLLERECLTRVRGGHARHAGSTLIQSLFPRRSHFPVGRLWQHPGMRELMARFDYDVVIR
jgi:hypothetical protein